MVENFKRVYLLIYYLGRFSVMNPQSKTYWPLILGCWLKSRQWCFLPIFQAAALSACLHLLTEANRNLIEALLKKAMFLRSVCLTS